MNNEISLVIQTSFPSFIRSSENPFQVSLHTNYRVYLFPLHEPIFQRWNPPRAMNQPARNFQPHQETLPTLPPGRSFPDSTEIKPSSSPSLQPLQLSCLLALFMPANYPRVRESGEIKFFSDSWRRINTPVTGLPPPPGATQFFGFPRACTRAEKSRWIPRRPCPRMRLKIPTEYRLLAPSPSARYVCEDRSYVCTRNVSRLDGKKKRLIFHSLRPTFSYWKKSSPFNISFVGQISSNKDFVYRWTIVGIMLGYGIWLILEEGPVSFLETGGNLP